MKFVFASFVAAAAAESSTKMRAVHAVSPPACAAPGFECIKVQSVATPAAKTGQALVRVAGSSVNPSDYKILEYCGAQCSSLGVLGNDVAGEVIECPGCTRLKVGDRVWGAVGHGLAEYTVADEALLGLIPSSVPEVQAATIPEVGLTGVSVYKNGGAPWAKKNLTVVVTSGSGGTGFLGIQLAKAYGASHVVTATSSANFDYVKSLGADTVVDYHEQDIFDYLGDDSVDIVYDNYGQEGTGDRAMHAIRRGGAYLMLPHGGCFTNKSQAYPCTAQNPKDGVANINVITGDYFSDPVKVLSSLDELKGFFEEGLLKASVMKEYPLEQTRSAYVAVAEGHVVGKVSVSMESALLV